MKNLEKMTFDEVITEYEDFHHGTVKDEVREFLYIAHSEIVEAYKRGVREGKAKAFGNLKDISEGVIAGNEKGGAK